VRERGSGKGRMTERLWARNDAIQKDIQGIVRMKKKWKMEIKSRNLMYLPGCEMK
jgi:hypothetical protein